MDAKSDVCYYMYIEAQLDSCFYLISLIIGRFLGGVPFRLRLLPILLNHARDVPLERLPMY